MIRRLSPLGALALLSVVYAWPLESRLTTAIPGGPGDRDVATFVWNVGWVYRALTQGGQLLRTDAVLIPFGADLRLHTYGLLQGLAAAPFVGWLGVVGAYNLVLVATLFLNGAVVYALVSRETGSRPAALVAAACLMFASPLLAQLRVGRPSFGSIWIVAAGLLGLRSLLDAPRPWKGFALGLVLLAAVLTDFQIVLFAAIWLVLYGVCRLLLPGLVLPPSPCTGMPPRGRATGTSVLSRFAGGPGGSRSKSHQWLDLRSTPVAGRTSALCPSQSHVLAIALAALVVGLPFLVVYYPALADAGLAGYAVPTLDDMQPYAFRYWDYLTLAIVPYTYGYESVAAVVGAALIFGPRGAYRFWLLSAGICLLLALGPSLQPFNLPLPFAALSLWPPLAQFRAPARLVMPALIGFAVVGGLVLARLLDSRPAWLSLGVVAILVVGRLLFALVHDPVGVQTYPEYAVYQRLAAEPGRLALVEVPFGVRSGLDQIGSGGEVLEYYQHIHGKPLLNAMIARLPAGVFAAYRQRSSLRFLTGDPAEADSATLEDDFADLLQWVHAGYVLVHRSLLSPEAAERIEAFLDRQPQLQREATERDVVLFRVSATLPDLGTPV